MLIYNNKSDADDEDVLISSDFFFHFNMTRRFAWKYKKDTMT